MSKEITLNSAIEILVFFKKYPKLDFDTMNCIVKAYIGDQLPSVIFTPVDKSKEDKEKPKKQLLKWLEDYADALDKGETPYCFFDTFKRE